MIYADGLKHCYYLIFANIIVDYKEQVFITGINLNIQCSIYYVLPQE